MYLVFASNRAFTKHPYYAATKNHHGGSPENCPGKEPGVIKSAEREKEKGKLIYSFDVQMPNGIHEVNVEAYSGQVLEDSIEIPEEEAKEKTQEKNNRRGRELH